jgi:ABC-type antimicrobial peptide transport system permease subunit
MLVRATTRRQELAIRRALGARPSLLVRQLLLESGLLAIAGALVGVLLAYWAVPLLVAMSPTAMPRAREIGSASRSWASRSRLRSSPGWASGSRRRGAPSASTRTRT